MPNRKARFAALAIFGLLILIALLFGPRLRVSNLCYITAI